MTIADLRQQNLLLFEAVSGSRAYGTNLPQSDTDLKGVFILPETEFFGLDYIAQIANETNDEVFYELRRFVELLLNNNPIVLELLGPRPTVSFRSTAYLLVLKRRISFLNSAAKALPNTPWRKFVKPRD